MSRGKIAQGIKKRTQSSLVDAYHGDPANQVIPQIKAGFEFCRTRREGCLTCDPACIVSFGFCLFFTLQLLQNGWLQEVENVLDSQASSSGLLIHSYLSNCQNNSFRSCFCELFGLSRFRGGNSRKGGKGGQGQSWKNRVRCHSFTRSS